MMKTFTALGAMLAIAGFATAALAETAMEQALAKGGKALTADEIGERLADKTVTFAPAGSDDRFLVYYDGGNGFRMKKVGSDKVAEGFYAVSVADHLCLGMSGGAPMRLRCVNVLLIDGLMHKFELDGSLRGHVIEEADGNNV